jgi:biopolymer transport protein ExbB/TolQ
MKYKIIIALTVIGIIAYLLWALSWYAWDEKQLWQYLSNTDYTNYLLIGEVIQASIILAATAITEIKPKTQPAQPQPTQTKEIKELTKYIKRLEKEVSNINIAAKLAPTKGGPKKRVS